MKSKSKTTFLLSFLSIAVIGALVMWLWVLPSLQLQGDPNAKGPDINRADPKTVTDKRGSFSDRLFEDTGEKYDHPLDPALKVAAEGLKKIQAEVFTYKALMVKQEQVNGRLLGEEYMRVKVRHAKPAVEPVGDEAGSDPVNKAFYVRHVKPKKMAGQEAIWIENENDGELIAHGTGLARLIKVSLDPTSGLAMRGNRYPITELGIETLMMRMLERGDRSRADADCTVEYDRSLKIDGNPCTLITITHPTQKGELDFHIAKIYIDDKLDLPVGYEGFWWPETDGGEPVLIERYFYRELELNCQLTDADFDPANPEYDYP